MKMDSKLKIKEVMSMGMALPEFKKLLDNSGWEIVSTKKQLELGTIALGFRHEYIVEEPKTDVKPGMFSPNGMYTEDGEWLNRRYILYAQSGYIRTWNVLQGKGSPLISSLDFSTEEGWKKGLGILEKACERKLRILEKDGAKILRTKEERYTKRGLLVSRKFGF